MATKKTATKKPATAKQIAARAKFSAAAKWAKSNKRVNETHAQAVARYFGK